MRLITELLLFEFELSVRDQIVLDAKLSLPPQLDKYENPVKHRYIMKFKADTQVSGLSRMRGQGGTAYLATTLRA